MHAPIVRRTRGKRHHPEGGHPSGGLHPSITTELLILALGVLHAIDVLRTPR